MAGLRQRLRVQQTEVVENAVPGRVAPGVRAAGPARRAVLPPGAAAGLGRQVWGPFAPGMMTVLALGVLLRLPGLTAAPLDTPSAPQATLAAFVRGIGPGQALIALPWFGPMPVDLTGGLPVWAWLAALPNALLPGQAWPGRLLSLLAGVLAAGLLFSVVRRLAGGRAALYAALFLTLSPLGLYYGRAYLPDALGWLLGLAAVGAALRWRDGCQAGRPRQALWFAGAAGAAGLAVAATPSQPLLLVPLLYIAWPRRVYTPDFDQYLLMDPHYGETTRRDGQRQLLGFALIALLPLLLWQVLIRVGNMVTPLDPALSPTPGAVVTLLTQGGFYGRLLGQLLNTMLTLLGFLLVLAGLGHRTRAPWPWLLHLWLAGALGGVLAAAPRLGTDESVLTPLLPPLAAFAGLGAAWLAQLPVQVMTVLRGGDPPEPAAEPEDGALHAGTFVAADTTATALTARPLHGAVRRQGWDAADPTGAALARQASWARTRSLLTVLGHTLVVAGFVGMAALAVPRLLARYQVDPTTRTYADAGRQVAAVAGTTGQVLVVGPGAPEIFYASGLRGWALAPDVFTRPQVDGLHAQGVGLLASADQAWLGRRPEYAGLLASFRVAVLDKSFIVFDLNTPPETTDRLYFLETGHTLRGGFRDFWEKNGGLAVFGFPLTEELQLPNPDDGAVRTMQVFERAVFELHDDVRQVMLAPLGRWLTVDKTGVGWTPIAATADTPERRYFPETGHSLRGAFLQAWNSRGGLALFGFPISQEVQEVDPDDGKVHTVQYFERARFEFHPDLAGTPGEVQLGLVGKEWWERRK